MGIDCSCTVGWVSSAAFADELGIPGLLAVDELGEPPIDPFCQIHGDDPLHRQSRFRRLVRRAFWAGGEDKQQ